MHNCARCAYRLTNTLTTAHAAGDETPFTFAVVVDVVDPGLMGADGLSMAVGPHGGASAAANPPSPGELSTIPSLLEHKEYVHCVLLFCPAVHHMTAHMNSSLTGVILPTRTTSSRKAGRDPLTMTVSYPT